MDWIFDIGAWLLVWIKMVPHELWAALTVCVLSALSAWLALGLKRADALTLMKIGRALFREKIDRYKYLLSCAERYFGRLWGARKPFDKDVGLGDVSEMIDIIQLGLKAGLSFDASLGLYCEGRDNALSRRMAHVRLCWQIGLMTREQGLKTVSHDAGLRQLESFSIAVAQALELGSPLAETLEAQSREIRAAHRADVERQIERAPVKLLIPTGTLILPALLLSIVGPLVAAGGMM